MKKPTKPVYRIVGNPGDPRAPYALVEPGGGTVVQIGATPAELSALAFRRFGDGIEVRHDEDLVAYEERLRR